MNNRDCSEIFEGMIHYENIEPLKNLGYNFIVVSWKNSYKDIKDNAMSVIALIDTLKRRNPNLAPLVVIGESMGGLVGRYALRYMETNNYLYDQTHPGLLKMHNTRLYITIDAPHKGANIPLSYQWMYRYLTSGGMPSLVSPFISSLIANSWRTFIDGKSARQMLLYHINSDALGFIPVRSFHYGPADVKTDFDNDLNALGNNGYPEFCKKVALANGSWRGDKQRRSWDESYRTANDHQLRVAFETYVKIRGKKLLGNEAAFDMQSEPDGDGDVFTSAASFYTFKIKIKRWRVDIGFFKTPMIGITKTALDCRSYDVAPGSWTIKRGADADRTIDKLIPSFGTGVAGGPMDVFHLHYDGAHGGIRMGASVGIRDFFRIGAGFDAFSDGTSFGFIPTGSAFDYAGFDTMNLNNAFIDKSVSDIMNMTPFDVVITNSTHLEPGEPSEDPDDRITRSNLNHLEVENSHEDFNTFKICNSTEDIYMVSSIINREIGDDSLYLENTYGVIPFSIEAYQTIRVNYKNPHYNYSTFRPSFSPYNIDNVSLHTNPHIVLSKENPYDVITTPHTFIANDVVDVTGLPSWDHVDLVGSMIPCCFNYLVFGRRTSQDSLTDFTTPQAYINVYPNPKTDGSDLKIEYSFKYSGLSKISVFNMTGQCVAKYNNWSEEDYKKCIFTLPNLPISGLYFVRIQNGDEHLQSKFTIIK